MCLHNVDFALEYDRGCRDFIGYGYKVLREHEYKKYKKWVKATGNQDGIKQELKSASIISSTKSGSYVPGFHIFLNQDDAINYRHRNTDSQLIKVKFRGVIGFGKNEVKCTWNVPKNDYESTYGPCIIASQMKLVEVLSG